MRAKMRFVYGTALRLAAVDKTMTAKELAAELNAYGLPTDRGEQYEGARGTFTLIDKTYDEVERVLGRVEAAYIAERFTDDTGELVWKKKYA